MALRFAAAERDSYHRLQLQRTFQAVVPWAEPDVFVRIEMDDRQRREFHEALLDADSFEDLPGKWQAAILKAEAGRPQLRVVNAD
jgi:hypothetical protein